MYWGVLIANKRIEEKEIVLRIAKAHNGGESQERFKENKELTRQ